jgi:hypothetical protein
MKKIAACAAVTILLGSAAILGSAARARAAEVVAKQWSVVFPDHTAIPEKFGAPIRERFGDPDTMQLPVVQMPASAPGRKVNPNIEEPEE